MPAVLPASYEEVAQAACALKGVAPRLQVDVCDGRCGRQRTWPLVHAQEWEAIVRQEEGLPAWEDIDYEVDLMAGGKEGRRLAEEWIAAGAMAIIFHPSCVGEVTALEELITAAREKEVEVGIGVRVGEDVSSLARVVAQADFVQVMGNREVGAQGLPLDLEGACRTLGEVRAHFQGIVGIDIGVNEATLPRLAKCGFRRFAVGSAIFGARDPKTQFRRLAKLAAVAIGGEGAMR